jgi:serine/threonine protein kinase
VAVKRVTGWAVDAQDRRNGLDMVMTRELLALRAFSWHPNVVRLREVATSYESLVLGSGLGSGLRASAGQPDQASDGAPASRAGAVVSDPFGVSQGAADIKIAKTAAKAKGAVDPKEVMESMCPHSFEMGDIFMVFDLVESDLGKHMRRDPAEPHKPKPLRIEMLQSVSHQLLTALAAMHRAGWLHRDVKPDNILITKDYRVKLADFGLARKLRDRELKEKVVTLWYRAPEVLFGAAQTAAIDMWSAGCIIVEMATGSVLFMENTEKPIVKQIIRTCGMPTAATWPGLETSTADYPHWHDLCPKARTREEKEKQEQKFPRRIREQFKQYVWPLGIGFRMCSLLAPRVI